jgi:hypothetical protein
MEALRGDTEDGEPKLLYVTAGSGHYVHGEKVYAQRAEDFLLLCKKILG